MMETYKSVILNNRPSNIVDSGYYADIRFDHNDDTPTYIGLHITQGVATTDQGWKIYKFSYTGTAAGMNVNHVEFKYGAWDDRTTILP